MGKFKEFLINEDVGLGHLGAKINQFINSPDLTNRINGAFLSTAFTGSEQAEPPVSEPVQLPSNELTVPKMVRSGRITHLYDKKNPIYVRLSDGTEAHFTYDEYRKIQGTPQVGSVMTIQFQRHPKYNGQDASKVDWCVVRN